MSVKSTIALNNKIYDKGKEKAEKYFNNNFSAYIAYLIAKDTEIEKDKN